MIIDTVRRLSIPTLYPHTSMPYNAALAALWRVFFLTYTGVRGDLWRVLSPLTLTLSSHSNSPTLSLLFSSLSHSYSLSLSFFSLTLTLSSLTSTLPSLILNSTLSQFICSHSLPVHYPYFSSLTTLPSLLPHSTLSSRLPLSNRIMKKILSYSTVKRTSAIHIFIGSYLEALFL